MGICGYFGAENYAWRLDIVQKPFVQKSFDNLNFVGFSCLIFWAQNVSILPSQKYPGGGGGDISILPSSILLVTPIFKSNDEYLLTDYRPISVLPYFSKILECIMYNRVYNILTENRTLYEKQFAFQSSHSTNMQSNNFLIKFLTLPMKKNSH